MDNPVSTISSHSGDKVINTLCKGGVTGQPDDSHIFINPADAVPKIPVPTIANNSSSSKSAINGSQQYNLKHGTMSQRRICGLPYSSFWLLLALIAVIIAAAIGGGVG